MSFPRYPKYKDSGVEWLGEVPEGWHIDRIKRSIATSKNGIWGDEANGDENDIPCIRVADFDRQRLCVALSDPTIRNVSEKEKIGRVLCQGDLLLEKSGGGENQPVGCVVLYIDQTAAVCSNFVSRIQTLANMNASYWRYLHCAAYFVRINTKSIKQTSGIQNLDESQYFDERVGFPPLSEQTQIAAFLDQETAKIDELISAQQHLIDLLKEKRQAVISHAVTKGLDPTVAMKDSGVEWLGEVPEGWCIRKTSQLFRVGKGKNSQLLTKEFCGANEGKYPVYSGQTEAAGIMGTWTQFEFDFEDAGVLFSTTVGAHAMHLRHLFGKFSLSQNCMIIWATSNRCVTRYFYYHFKPLFRYQREMIPEHMQASFRMEDFYTYVAALPSREEQLAIAAFLDQETAKIDALITEAKRAIDLLKERRSALISAAVTGQIDVRSFVSQEST